MKLKKGDNITVLLGKDRGKTGKIEKVVSDKGRVFVSGINLVKRHIKKQREMEGGIVDIMKSLDISNVAIVCPKCKKPTRIGYEIKGTDKNRICKRCKEVIGV